MQPGDSYLHVVLNDILHDNECVVVISSDRVSPLSSPVCYYILLVVSLLLLRHFNWNTYEHYLSSLGIPPSMIISATENSGGDGCGEVKQPTTRTLHN